MPDYSAHNGDAKVAGAQLKAPAHRYLASGFKHSNGDPEIVRGPCGLADANASNVLTDYQPR